MTTSDAAFGRLNVLVSSAGRRVALINAFRKALDGLGLVGRILAADLSHLAPAAHCADDWVEVPPCTSADFVPRMLDVCVEHEIGLVVPTIDTELAVWAEHRELFAGRGVTVLVSSPEVVAIGSDKVATHEWLIREGFPTVPQLTLDDPLVTVPDWPFPLIVKPRRGSNSVGVRQVQDLSELAHARRGRHDLVLQQIAPGDEFTISMLADRDGTCRCAVPRQRLEVRAGEVSKARTVRSPALEQLATRLCNRLPGVRGPLNLQVMKDRKSGALNIIELNPRFGGGCPLAFAAGADFPLWLIAELLDVPIEIDPGDWRDNLLMLRYDEAVFVDGSDGDRIA